MWIEHVTLMQQDVLRGYGRAVRVCQEVGGIEHSQLAEPVIGITY